MWRVASPVSSLTPTGFWYSLSLQCVPPPSRQGRQTSSPFPKRRREGSGGPSDPVKLAVPGDEALHADLDRGRGLEADSLLQRIDIGVGLRDVAGLRRKHLELCLAAERVLDHRDIVEQSDG